MRFDSFDRSRMKEEEILKILKKEAPLDTKADFWCEFCEETRKMVFGEGGRILDLFYSNRLDQIDR